MKLVEKQNKIIKIIRIINGFDDFIKLYILTEKKRNKVKKMILCSIFR